MTDTADLDQDFYSRLQALMAASTAAGHPVGVESGYRTTAEQTALYNQYGPGRAALPGTSMHEKGLAVDLSGDYSWAHQHAAEFGLYFPMGWEPWHIQPLGVGHAVPGQSARPGVPGHVLQDPAAARQRIVNALNIAAEGLKATSEQQGGQITQATTQQNQVAAASTNNDATVASSPDQSTAIAQQQAQQPEPENSPGMREPGTAQGLMGHGPSGGPGGDMREQLKQGFLAAGRKDLADMVDTKAFNAWINEESGWNPTVISPANNQGKANGGLFQFWFGHTWANQYVQGGKFTATPYQQAYLAATQFNLTPQKINMYANQINNGTYVGWG